MKYKIVEYFLGEERKVLCWTDSLDNVIDILDALSGDVDEEDFEYDEGLILNKEYSYQWNSQYKYKVELCREEEQ